MTLLIQHTWDGSPVDDTAQVLLSQTPTHIVLRCIAPFCGDPPPSAEPGPTDALWNHEVVEWFCVGDHAHYLEVELGPHGHHLVLQLEGVRNPVRSRLEMTYQARIFGDRWAGEAHVPVEWLPKGPRTTNAYRIHGTAERHYQAAFPVPGDGPDFHRIAAFGELPELPTHDGSSFDAWLATLE